MTRHRILVVEDDTIISMQITQSIADWGWEAMAAFSGEEALEVTERFQPCLALMDIRLGSGMDGIQTALELRKRWDIPAVFLSAFSSQDLIDRAKQAEPYGYLVKPVQEMDLRRTLDMALFRREMDLKLRDSELRYRRIVETATEGIWTMDAGRRTTFVNPRMAEMLGCSAGEMAGRPVEDFMFEEDLAEHNAEMAQRRQGKQGRYERRFRRKDGSEIWCLVSALALMDPHREFAGSFGMFTDITDRKRAEQTRQAERDLMRICHFASSKDEMLRDLTEYLSVFTGCRAVGVRLRKGEDYPYYEARGFPPEFLTAEKSLCARDDFGGVVRDEIGNPVLDCMCGNILQGRFDPSKPFFTPNGSFWTNSTTQLLASTSEADRQARTRNRCNGEGYESVALIPLRSRGETFGLFQFNDPQPNRFTPERIRQLEGLADYIAMAIARQEAAEALETSEAGLRKAIKQVRRADSRHRVILDTVMDGYFFMGLDQRIREVNPAFCQMTGYSSEQLLAMSIADIEAAETPEQTAEHIKLLVRQGTQRFETRHRTGSGQILDVEISATYTHRDGGGVFAFIRDITERKRAETALRESEGRVRAKLAALLLPEGDVGELSLADIVDSPRLQAIMDDFHRLTGIGMAIMDLQDNVLVATGWQDICTRFHRQHPETRANCIESDTGLSLGIPAGEYKAYKCRNNMWDMATPIHVGGRHVGNFFLGQFFFEDETPEESAFREQARRYGFDEEEYVAALRRVPRWSRETVKRAMEFYTLFAGMISDLSYGNLKLARALEQGKRVENALLESEALHEVTQRLSKTGGWRWDVQRQTMTWTDETYRIHDMTPGAIPNGSPELVARSLACYDAEDREAIKRAFERCAGAGEPYDLEAAFVTLKGRALRVRTTGEAVWEAGRIVSVVGHIMDITELTQAQEALRISEERLRLAHKATNDVVWDWDVSSDSQRWNEAGAVVFGWKDIVEAPQTAQWWVDRVHPDDRQRLHDSFFMVVNDPGIERWQDEYRFRKADGSYAQVLDRGFVLRDSKGKATRMIGAMLDITERTRAETALRESEKTLRSVFNAISESVALLDADGQVLAANRTFAERLGRTVNQCVGENVFSLVPPAVAERRKARVMKLLQTGRPLVFEDERDGRFMRHNLWPVLDETGCPARVVTYATDITEQRTAEAQLRLQGMVLDQIADHVTITDLQGRIIYVNEAECRTMGQPADQIVGQTVHVYGEDASRGARQDQIIAETQTKGEWRGIVANQAADGRQLLMDCRTSMVKDPSGQPVAMVGIATDVTERQRFLDAIVQRERELARAQQLALVGSYQWELATGEMRWSDELFAITGCQGLEPSFDLVISHLHPEDRERVVKAGRAAVEEGAEFDVEYRMIRPDGALRWFHDHCEVERGPDGRPVRVFGAAQDITERKAAEEALRREEERYRSLVMHAPDAVFVNQNDRVVLVNEAALKLFGARDENELLGRSVYDLFHPDYHGAIQDRVCAMRETGQPAPAMTEKILRLDGGETDVEVKAAPFGANGGGAIHVILRDITERKRAEDVLRALAESGDSADGDIFRFLVRQSAEALDKRYALIARLDQDDPGMARTLGVWADGVFADNFAYALKGTPCEQVLSGGPCLHPRGVQDIFPTDDLLRKMGAESYWGTPLRDSAGKVIGLMAVLDTEPLREHPHAFEMLHSIATRAAAEIERRRTEEKYQDLFRGMLDGVAIHEIICDGQGQPVDYRFLAVNPAFETMTGLKARDIIGKTVCEALPNTESEWVRIYGAVALTGKPIRFERYSRELRKHFEVLAYRNAPRQFACVISDITGRVEAARALRASEEKHRDLVQLADAVILQWKPDGEITFINEHAQRMFGYAPEELLGRNVVGTIVPKTESSGRDLAVMIEEIGRDPERFRKNENENMTKDGRRVWLRWSNRAVLDAQGEVAGVLSIGLDITDRKQMEAERQEMERRFLHTQKLESLGVLAGGVAHDFNNILAAILGNLDLAAPDLPPGSEPRKGVDRAIAACRRASDLTRQMLAYSGKGKAVVKPVNINDLVRENAHLFRAVMAKTAGLELELGESLPAVNGDPGQLQQVVMNLITNATEALSGRPGTVTIRTSVVDCEAGGLNKSLLDIKPPPGRYVRIDVRDTGCGMDEATIGRIFEPFFTTKATGRGLGMAAVAGIVRGHRGAILVESQPGKGTVFRLFFPAAGQTEAGAAASIADSASARAGRGSLVLVADDEPSIRGLVAKMVSYAGYEPLEASDGVEALELYRKNAAKVGCVILDRSMPRMDGLETLREMRRISPDVKVILTSGFEQADALSQLGGEEVSGFLHKPFSVDDLSSQIARALE